MSTRRDRVARLPMGLVSLDFDDLTEMYRAAEERGLGWVEIYVGVSADESDLHLIERERDERGIRVVSVSSMAKLSQASDEEVAEHARLIGRSIRLAAASGAPFATFMYGSRPGLDRVAARSRFLRRVAPLVELANHAGVTLLIENVFSRGGPGDLDSVEVTLELFDELDTEHIGLNFDPANFAIAGEEPYPRAYRQLRHLIRYMHLKDVRPVEGCDRPLGDRRVLEDHARGPFIVVPLGEGAYDVAGLISEVADDDRGIVVALEPTAKDGERAAWLDASIAFLARCGVVPDGER